MKILLIVINLDINIINNINIIYERLNIYLENHNEYIINSKDPIIINNKIDIKNTLLQNVNNYDNIDIKKY